ncbi:MAG TPA: MBOAT family O-acyltransferase [Kofleriaceae bacterium]|nr:MBOAT family O-acyltransferase [Kofleriaceae bacterium]
MIFTSYEFALVFLPAVVAMTYVMSALGRHDLAKLVVLGASFVYYGWWNPAYVPLLLAMIAFNYAIGSWLIRTRERDDLARKRLAAVTLGVAANVLTLGYFKYTNFLVDAANSVTGAGIAIAEIALPLGISFIVFQKIAFLVDAYAGQIKRLGLLDYSVFVSFFPQLIAGPIVHHREVIPQLQEPSSLRYHARVVPIALAFFVIGACKKVLLADPLSPYVAEVFSATAAGGHPGALGAWSASLAFTLQVYFDFSGYSDMAIGLGLLFGIRLPTNFNSPLKAASMIEFWSRWHMTLTRFLTAYIYNPLVLRVTRRRMQQGKKIATRGVMRPGAFVELLVVPTLITMFIAGLWHGAGFQFIVFGLLHGVYLVVNHAWRNFHGAGHAGSARRGAVVASRVATFAALVVSIPWFRGDSVHTAWGFATSMLGLHGAGHARLDGGTLLLIAVLLVATQVLPSSQELLRTQLEAETSPLAKHAGAGKTMDPAHAASWSWPRIAWRPTVAWALALGLVAWIVLLRMAAPTEFLYFQF